MNACGICGPMDGLGGGGSGMVANPRKVLRGESYRRRLRCVRGGPDGSGRHYGGVYI